MQNKSGIARGYRRVSLVVGSDSSPFLRYLELERIAVLEVAGEFCTGRQRTLMILHYGSNLTLTEIAEYFGVSRPAVAQMHVRALRELRQALLRMGIKGVQDLV